MKYLLLLTLSLVSSSVYAQDTTLVLTSRMFSPDQQINVSALNGWVYKAGHNPDWSKPGLNATGWAKRSPSTLSVKDADKTGRVEGWFRLRLKLDSTFRGMPLGLRSPNWAAIDVYANGQLIASFGNTGTNGNPYKENTISYKPSVHVDLAAGQEYLIAVHLVDYVSPFPHFPGKKLKSQVWTNTGRIIQLTGPRFTNVLLNAAETHTGYLTLWSSVSVLTALLFWLLASQNLYEKKTIRLFAVLWTWGAISNLSRYGGLIDNTPFVNAYLSVCIVSLGIWQATCYNIAASLSIFGYRIKRQWFIVGMLVAFAAAVADVYVGGDVVVAVANIILQFFYFYLIVSSWKRLNGAQWTIVAGICITVVFSTSFAIFQFTQTTYNFYLLFTGVTLSIPLSFLVYITLRFKEIIAEDQQKAAAVLQLTEEKRELLADQNQHLEQQVEARTAELKISLETLKSTQTQLVQKEKLASLGELTAGIAHEIQNPLNFVNNFSEVSTELVSELKDELDRGDTDEAKAIADDLTQNLRKITHHGGRASAIVKGMLEHSRTGTGEKQPTNLNALADEYLKIAFHGQRAKDKHFNATLVTDFAADLGKVAVVPQELGRVLLNLYNNAFYAVSERAKQTSDPDYKPTVEVSTKWQADQSDRRAVVIRVQDNGTGIPDAVKAKIFQPFFTTKPTGEGTGLGLSLSYDIVTKGHGGTLTLESVEGEGTTFLIDLLS